MAAKLTFQTYFSITNHRYVKKTLHTVIASKSGVWTMPWQSELSSGKPSVSSNCLSIIQIADLLPNRYVTYIVNSGPIVFQPDALLSELPSYPESHSTKTFIAEQ